MKILVTGACGFVGSTLIHELLTAQPDVSIVGIDNFSRAGSEINRQSIKQLGVQLIHADLRMASDFESLPKVDWVVDAAAIPSVLAGVDGKTNSRQLLEHNLIGTINMLEFCKKHSAGFILMSTSRVYSVKPLANLPVKAQNDAFGPIKPDLWPKGFSKQGVSEVFSTTPPVSLYGATKVASETLALEYGNTFNFPVWINRCGVLAGAGQFGHAEQGIFSFWVNAWLHRKPLKYIGFGGTGQQVRDCLHPRDLLPVMLKQMNSTEVQEQRIFNLSGGIEQAMSLAQLSNWCTNRMGAHEVAAQQSERPFDIPWLVLDSQRAKKRWEWTPKNTLEDILEEIYLFAKKHPNWLEQSSP